MTNGQKAQQIREKRAKESAGKGGGSQLEANKKAMNVICVICRQPFMCTSKEADLLQHAQNKHGKGTLVKKMAAAGLWGLFYLRNIPKRIRKMF